MNMQTHEWLPVNQINERIKDFHREAEAERLVKIAKANQPEAYRNSFQRVAQYILSPFKQQAQQPKPVKSVQHRRVLRIRNRRHAA
jgi:hypothetical protein